MNWQNVIHSLLNQAEAELKLALIQGSPTAHSHYVIGSVFNGIAIALQEGRKAHDVQLPSVPLQPSQPRSDGEPF